MSRRILVIGGAGVFGSRLTNGILATSDLKVVVAGRSKARCDAFIALHDASERARLSVAVIDTNTVTAAELAATGAFVVVDAAGPFQGQKLCLARAAIEARLHYVDLADGRDFVSGIKTLDLPARLANVAVLSGASSTPALTSAVLDELVEGWKQVDHVRTTILPGNRAPRGVSVVRSILSYAGQPVRLLLHGTWRRAPGWGMTRRIRIPELGCRWAALCDTPDLDVIPARFHVRRSAVMQAGLQLSILHLGLLLGSLLVRARLLRTLAPFAAPSHLAAGLFENAGTDRGAMLVEAWGVDTDGRLARATWTLIAGAGDGPEIPALPALATIKALANGQLTRRGAGPCIGLVSLADVENEFCRFDITTRRHVLQLEDDQSLFETALGADFELLPEAVKVIHDPGWGATFYGQARVDGPTGVMAAVIARLLGLPPASESVPLRVDIDVDDTGERWTRDFGGRRFVSRLALGIAQSHITERFGLFSFDVALSGTKQVLRWEIISWRVGWLRLPRTLMPAASAEEMEDANGQFHFNVAIHLPLGLGRVVRYYGSLNVQNAKLMCPVETAGRKQVSCQMLAINVLRVETRT